MDEQKYILSNLVDLTGFIKSFLTKSSRIKYTVFDASREYLILAANSGSLYIFRRNPFSFVKIIPTTLGQISKIAISNDDCILAFSNNSTIAFVDLRQKNLQFSQVHLREATVSCFHWSYDNKQLFVGDKSGNVSVVNLSYFIGRNLLNVSLHPILLLDNPIVQICGFNDYLLVSTTTKTVLCNSEKEIFKQIGNRPRDGEFGACITVNYEKMEQQQKQIMINTIDDYELMLKTNVRIYCARPGLRLWEADLNGNVSTTLQFRNVLNSVPKSVFEKNGDGTSSGQSTIIDKHTQFRTMYTLCHMFLVIFNSSGFFIIDPLHGKVLFWTNVFNKQVASAKLIDNCIFLHLNDGKMLQINFYKFEQYVYHLCETEQNNECCELLANDVDYMLKLVKNQRGNDNGQNWRILLKLKDYLIKQGMSEVLERMGVIFEEISMKKVQNVLILNKNLLSGKTGMIEISEDDVKEQELETIPQPPIIQKKQESQEQIPQEEIDRIVKKMYMVSQAFPTNSSIRYAQIFDQFNSHSIIKILETFEEVLVQDFDEDKSHEKIIKIYFDYLNPELIYELDENTLDFIKNGLIFINQGTLNIKHCNNCNYPLNLCELGSSKYENIGIRLQTYYWSRQEREKCFEIAQNVPTTLKIIGKFLIEERNYEKMIRYVVNIGDSELLRAALEHFNDFELFKELIDDFSLLILDRKIKCLNCNHCNDAQNFNLSNFYTWNNLFMEIGKCLSGDELLNLLLNYSDRVNHLSREFYLRMLIKATDV